MLNMVIKRTKMKQPMETKVFKAMRLPVRIVKQIEKVVEDEGSTFSQFLRTAAINELKRRKAA